MRVNTARSTVFDVALPRRVTGADRTEYIGTGPVRCQRPLELHMFGFPDRVNVGLGLEPDRAVSERVAVRCRKCENCLRYRGRLWTARAMDECKFSQRTWMGTLTLAPDRQTWARYSAHLRMSRRMSDFSEDKVFEETVGFISPEITRFLKRVRKVAPFRYLLVTEKHKSGLPHFHMLLHEYAGAISKRVLEDKWRYGYSHWRLVETGDARACGYVCKYLAKSALTRVRGSKDYGQGGHIALRTERVLEATRTATRIRGAANEGLLNE